MICGGRGADANGGNSRKQGGKEKDRGHDGDETSTSKGMFAMSFHLLEGGISKREVSGFWARGDRGRLMVETRRIKMKVPVNGSD
jgi:hypothetical protein